MNFSKKLHAIILIFQCVMWSSMARAIETGNLPGSTEPGVVSKTLSQELPNPTPRALSAPIKNNEKSSGSLGPEAAKIKFQLTNIILEDNHVYSEAELRKLYQAKLNTRISIAELQDIVQSITNYYRNNGYILSRAILPPQRVKNGVVRVRIIEGFIDQVKVVGDAKGAKKILLMYGRKIANSRPLQLKVMEYYLRLANDVPGLQVKAVLEPAKDKVGASDLNLTAVHRTFSGSLSYDNYGTRYIGPLQITATGGVNSTFQSGDTTQIAYITTTSPKELKFTDLYYQVPMGTNGLTFKMGGNKSITRPSYFLTPLDVVGNSETYYGLFQYPYLRSREQNLTLNVGFDYVDSAVNEIGLPFYKDHIRTLKFGGNYDFADRFKGNNILSLEFEKGLYILGATGTNPTTPPSRVGATGVYTKAVLSAARLQYLNNRFSAYGLINAQYTLNPLLASEQFAFGGSQLGRGYDPAEIIGDQGAAGSLELRMSFAPGLFLLQALEPYIFYDIGAIWNRKDVVNVPSKQSAASIGIGSRFIFNQYLTGNFIYAQPLTKDVAAEALIGRGKNPRIFFSILASI